jgi:hypothetical protein
METLTIILLVAKIISFMAALFFTLLGILKLVGCHAEISFSGEGDFAALYTYLIVVAWGVFYGLSIFT